MTSTQTDLHPLLASRRSPRAFDSAHELTRPELDRLLEAARWAASASNTQPWRFLVGTRGTPAYDAVFDLLVPGNQLWAGAASALVLVAAQTESADGRPYPWAAYDTGQAVAQLTLQATHDGLIVHQMGGFDSAAASTAFSLAPTVEPLVVIAIGRHDPQAPLPEALAARETAPRERRALADLLL